MDNAAYWSDERIKQEFQNADEICFSAKPYNFVWHRFIGSNPENWFPLLRVLPIQGITPEMLQPVFSAERSKESPVPEGAGPYGCLGILRLNDRQGFQELAKLFGKPLHVFRHKDFEDWDRFTIHPDGTLIEAFEGAMTDNQNRLN